MTKDLERVRKALDRARDGCDKSTAYLLDEGIAWLLEELTHAREEAVRASEALVKTDRAIRNYIRGETGQ